MHVQERDEKQGHQSGTFIFCLQPTFLSNYFLLQQANTKNSSSSQLHLLNICTELATYKM